MRRTRGSRCPIAVPVDLDDKRRTGRGVRVFRVRREPEDLSDGLLPLGAPAFLAETDSTSGVKARRSLLGSLGVLGLRLFAIKREACRFCDERNVLVQYF